MNSIYDFKIKNWKGEEVDFSVFKNKVLLIVNTATKCGFTPQYKELDLLYDKYKDKGFEILDFPCNQFFHQAPGTSDEYHETCRLKFLVEFYQFEKIEVNGKNEHPLYHYLKEKSNGKRIKWNFTKFLVNRNGEIIARFEPATKPLSFEEEIVKLLNK